MEQYKDFQRGNLINDWEELLKLERDEVVSIQEQWETIQEENEDIGNRNADREYEAVTKAVQAMKEVGIDVFKYSRSVFPKKIGYKAWFKNNVVNKIRDKYRAYSKSIPTAHMKTKEVNGIVLTNNQSPTNLVQLYDRIRWQYDSKVRDNKYDTKLLVKSIEYASEKDIDIEGREPKEIIDVVQETAKIIYLKENVPGGTEIYLKHECDDCSTYYMGDRRCSCGNRRISIEVDGDILDGFYHYPEPY